MMIISICVSVASILLLHKSYSIYSLYCYGTPFHRTETSSWVQLCTIFVFFLSLLLLLFYDLNFIFYFPYSNWSGWTVKMKSNFLAARENHFNILFIVVGHYISRMNEDSVDLLLLYCTHQEMMRIFLRL